jgi:predicted RNA-binding protein with TRAM domain
MTQKCPTCGGDGIVISETSAAVEVERRLRSLAAASRSQAFRVEVAPRVASLLIGPGASRLAALEELTKRRFFLEPKDGMHLDHFVVLAEGKLADVRPSSPVEEGAEIRVELVEVARNDLQAAIGKLDGIDVCVGQAASLVGKKVRVRVERVLDGVAYASLVQPVTGKKQLEPLTAEGEAEKPTRKPPSRKASGAVETLPAEPAATETDAEEPEEPVAEEPETAETEGAEPAPARKSRRGSRGGRRRKKTGAAAAASPAAEDGAAEPSEEVEPEIEPSVRIHLPDEDLGRPTAVGEPAEPGDGAEPEAEQEQEGEPKPKRKTRRGTRGGRGRKQAGAAAAAPNGDGPAVEPEASEPEADALEPAGVAEPETSSNGDGAPDEYVPMSEWIEDFDRRR